MTPPRRTSTIIVNRAARNIARFNAERAMRLLARHGIDTIVVEPRTPADSTAAAREAAVRRCDLVFAVGGDGSQRAVAEGLRGSATALAAIPAGTTNVWVREVGLSLDPLAAFAAHARGQVVDMDLGLAGGAPFLLMAGVGWDAAVVRRTNTTLKRYAGAGAYVARFVTHLPALRPRWTRWIADGATFVDNLGIMVLSNARLYGGVTRFSRDAFVDDGLLDVCAFCPRNLGDGVANSLRLLAGRLEPNAAVRRQRIRELTIVTPDLEVQLDGDAVGTTPMTFGIAPRGLRVSLSAGPLPPIFGGKERGYGG